MTETPDTTPVRVADPSVWEPAGRSRPLGWLLYVNPLVGLLGVLIGASLVRQGKPRVRA